MGVGVVRGVGKIMGGGECDSDHAGTFSDNDGRHALGLPLHLCTFRSRHVT